MTPNTQLNIGIIGASGYAGGELARILDAHPYAGSVLLQSKSLTGTLVNDTFPDLDPTRTQRFASAMPADRDVIFLCAPHGQSQTILSQLPPSSAKIIDLAADYRDASNGFIYGLPESQRERIQTATRVANPGCFATAIQLALLPAFTEGLGAETVHVTAITGSTGAGTTPMSTTHHSCRAHNVSLYKVFEHQHLPEITRTLANASGMTPNLVFVPMRGPFTRGILASVYWETSSSLDELTALYRHFFQSHPFVTLRKTDVDLKLVLGTNACFLHLKKVGPWAHVTAVLDNLVKGAAGQAVQNMNLMFGLAEKAGLSLKAMVN